MYIERIDVQGELKSNLDMAKKDLDAAYNNYQFASNNDSIDYYIYQIKACQSRFDAILKQIKQMSEIAKKIVKEAG